MNAMHKLPRISIVTSCFNAEEFVGDTIRSVVDQRYPDCEYIFLDACSSDGTLSIASNFHGRGISELISEPDDGQYYGIQNGLNKCTGEVMAWLNGDDTYLPWTFSVVGEIFATMPEVEWIVGTPGFMNSKGQCTRVSGVSGNAYPRSFIKNGWFRGEAMGYIQQESMFWRRRLWERVGGLNLNLKLAADFDLWRRFSEHAELHSVNAPLALFRQRPGVQRSSAGRELYESEVKKICEGLDSPPYWWRTLSMAGESGRHLARMLTWRRGSVISYSSKQQRWVRRSALRPVARTSWADLLLEHSVRSASGDA